MANDPAFLPSYRAIRRSRRIDPATRRLLATAGGIGAVLAVAIAAWSLLDRGPSAVPVIAAPSGPMRVKPAKRGGMSVVGLNQDLMDDGASDEGVKMQSGPEQPALAALHALEGKAPAATAPPAAPLVAAVPPANAPPAAPADVAAPPASTSPAAPMVATAPPANGPPAVEMAAPPVASTPAQTAATPAAANPLASPATAPKPASAGTQVQLAAMGSRQAAMAEWQQLAQRMPTLLADHQPTVERAEVDGRTVWRLRTGGFATIAVATRFCQQVRAQGGGCTIAAF